MQFQVGCWHIELVDATVNPPTVPLFPSLSAYPLLKPQIQWIFPLGMACGRHIGFAVSKSNGYLCVLANMSPQ